MSGFDASPYYEATPGPETQDYKMQALMIRVKDPKKSLDFYTKVLGFRLVFNNTFDIGGGFTVFFLAPPSHLPKDCNPKDLGYPANWNLCMNTPGCIKLVWNHGTEKDDVSPLEIGNKGFAGVNLTVPDVYVATERMKKEHDVTFIKSPNGGAMKGLAQIKDPDGYIVAILPQGEIQAQDIDCCGVKKDEKTEYKDNSK